MTTPKTRLWTLLVALGLFTSSCARPAGAAPNQVGEEGPVSGVSRAAAPAQLYSSTELAQAKSKYAPALQGIWSDLVERLPPAIQPSARSVRLVLPHNGRASSPLDFYSLSSERSVHIPIRSVKFLDDIATAIAVKEERGCDTGAVFDYVGMLATDRSGIPAPLAAFGLDANSYKSSSFVYDVSGKVLKSAIYFIMAHELAHVLQQHPGNAAVKPEVSQSNERAADRFALDEMARIGVAPVGMVYYFMAVSRYEPPPQAIDPDELERWHATHGTHPISAARIAAIADGIRSRSAQFEALATEQTVRSVASDTDGVARIMTDPDFRRFQYMRSKSRPVATLVECPAWSP